MILWQDENEFIRAAIYNDASAEIIDTKTGEVWRMGRVALQEDNVVDVGHVWLRQERSICEEYPGRFRGEKQGDSIRYTLIGREGREVGEFSVGIRLVENFLEFCLFDIDSSLPSLVFPPPIESESLILPQEVGRWVKERIPGRRWMVYPAHLRMRWFGGLHGDNGWIAILHEGYADGGMLVTGFHASPAWLQTLGTWQGERVVRYGFTQNGYVGMAKRYRAYAIEQGMYKSLREKLSENRAAQNLLGADLLAFFQGAARYPERYEDLLQAPPTDLPAENPHVYVTHRDAHDLIQKAKASGVEKALVVLRGWINGGYDETHPDIFPIEPKLGTVEELKALLALDNGITTALHDNYQDIYQQSRSFPNGVVRTRTGELMRGGLWAGGQAYILDALSGLHYAQRNWDEIAALNPRSMFIDTTIAVQLYENYAEGNHLSRADDLRYKQELLAFYKERGQVLGSEEGADFGVPYVEWIENRHTQVAGTSIPLWGLIFHDAAFYARYNRPTHDFLTDMLWGYMLLWDFREPSKWQANLDGIIASRHVAKWHERVGLDEMLSHRYLSEDVEETVFSSGVAIITNFASEAHTVEGITIPAQGYVIRE
jgi:hypothetical protein